MDTLKQPSDFYDAISSVLEAKLKGVTMLSYAEFGDADVADAMVLIEFEEALPCDPSAEGRKGYDYQITLHAVVGRHRHRPELDAINLSAAIAQVVEYNKWGIPGLQAEWPEGIRQAPSMFKKGAHGYEAWGVSFSQKIYLGPSLLDDNPVVSDVWMTVTPPANSDNPEEYEKVVNEGLDNVINTVGA